MSDYVELGKRISRSALKDAWQHERTRAEAAEAEVERLTRECLDREATETDARERLRRCEERLAAVEAAAQGAGLHGIVRLVRGERRD